MRFKKNNYLTVIITTTIINILCAKCLVSAQMHWEKMFDSLSYKLNTKPAPRRDAAIGHDRERNRVILFGGWQTNHDPTQVMTRYTMPVLFDDTWEFDLQTKIWRQLSFSMTRPSARYGMLYTHNKHGLYISCGRGWLDNYFNDLWIYDFAQDQWRRMDQTFISILPEPRFSVVGGIYPAYEYTNEIKTNLFLAMGRTRYTMYTNMFSYTFTDLRSLTGIWEMIYTDIWTGPFSFTHPHGRAHASSTMLSPDELLIHGGCLSGALSGGPCPSADSWIYSYSKNKWEKVDASCISPRKHSSMASIVSDGFRKSAVMFSGQERDKTLLKTDLEREEEVSLFDSMSRRWVRKRVQGFFFPEKRDGHIMCTGKLNNDYGVFMFGGYGHYSDSNLADLWFLRVNITSAFDNPILTSFYSDDFKQPEELCANHFSTIHVHAVCMFVGWAVFLNIGAFIGRYADSKDEYKHKIVVRIHGTLKVIGILFVTAGIVFGFWSTHGIPHLSHVFIGLTAYIIALLQPISSYLRNRTKKFDYYIDEEEKLKAQVYKASCFYSIFKLINENLNRTAIICAILNMSLGVFYAVFDWFWIMIWFIYLGIFFSLFLILEARAYFDNPKNQTGSGEENNTNNNKKSSDDEEYEDEFNFSLSKSSSTQQLRPSGSGDDGRSSKMGESFQLEPIRYTPNVVRDNKQTNNITNTPPPPYFNKNKQQQQQHQLHQQSVSTINFENNSEFNSPTLSSSKRVQKSNAHQTSYLNRTFDNQDEQQQQIIYGVKPRGRPITTGGITTNPANSSYSINQRQLSPNASYIGNDSIRESSHLNHNHHRGIFQSDMPMPRGQQRSILNNEKVINYINNNILNVKY